jgi:L-lactate dehydrogenase complex protein LldF
VCPVRIDLPRLLVQLRHEAMRWRATPVWLRLGLRLYRLAATRPGLFRAAASLARTLSRSLAPGGHFRHLPFPLSGWTAHRDFPAFAEKPFSLLMTERGRRPIP